MYICKVNPTLRKFDLHTDSRAISLTLRNAGIRIPINTAMIAITTNSSINVNPLVVCLVALCGDSSLVCLQEICLINFSKSVVLLRHSGQWKAEKTGTLLNRQQSTFAILTAHRD